MNTTLQLFYLNFAHFPPVNVLFLVQDPGQDPTLCLVVLSLLCPLIWDNSPGF